MRKQFLILILFCGYTIASKSQSVNGPTPVVLGQTAEYTFNDGTIYNSTSWSASNMGTITKLPNIGASHRVSITWTSTGTASVTFLNNYVRIGGTLSVIVNLGAPATSFNIVKNCGSTNVTRTTNPPDGVNWYWQTSAGGTSTALGLGASVTITSNTTLYLRARLGTSGVWSTGSQSVGSITVNTIPAAPPSSTDGHRISNTAVSVPLSVASVSTATGYNWYDQSANGSLLATTTLNTYNPTLTAGKTYWVAAVKSGCESTTRKSVQAFIHPEPVLAASNNGVVTPGIPVTLSVPNYTYDSYSWLDENDQAIVGATSPTFSAYKGGKFKVKVVKGLSSPFISPYSITVTSVETQPENFIISNSILVDNILNESQIAGLPVESLNQSIEYFDGLGRPIQSVITQGSPQKKDVVQPFCYDAFGREVRSYLPVTLNEGNGLLKTGILDPVLGYVGPAAGFYAAGSDNQIDDDDQPFGINVFDDSPSNKISKSYAAGKDWYINNKATENKMIVNTDGTSSGQERIIRWTLNTSGLPVRSGYYPSNTLQVTYVRDEDGSIVKEYANRLGQVVLRKMYVAGDANLVNSSDVWSQTYHIHDDSGFLRFVLQPELAKVLAASTTANPSSAQLRDFSFQYKYDQRQRVIVKCIPGADTIMLVYDGRDRLVATQDGNQRNAASKEWLVTKYDEWNRAVLTAKYVSNESRTALQNQVNTFYSNLAAGKAWFETYGGAQSGYIGGYDNKSFPGIVNESQLLTVTYYDLYDSYIAPTGFSYNVELSGQDPAHSSAVGGLVTGTKTKNLTTGIWLRNVNYYNSKYRLIQTISDHQKGTVRVSNIFDFPGRLTMTKRSYVVNGTSTSIVEKTSYDHASRMANVRQSINGGPEIILTNNAYNEIGQLIDRKLHSVDNGVNFSQSVDYRYNIRGWLSRINDADVSAIAPGDNSYDYFGMELLYNKAIAGINNTANYNGNISAIRWSNGQGGIAKHQAYKFHYDRMNRLLSANHLDYANTSWLANNNAFDETQTYDFNGNIKTLLRKGSGGFLMDNLTYGYTGNRLNYVHDGGDNASGFVNGNTGSDDYSYDHNGNMISDKNKGIASAGITYNYLNLVQEVVKSGETLKYLYDATGRKLAQELYNGSTLVNRTDYIGELVYEGDALKFISTNEGRIVKAGSTWEYQYFLKDHLGNVRITFTTKPQAASIVSATFESGTQSSEQNTFNNYSSITFDLVDHTDPGTTYQKVQLLNGGTNGRVGLAKSISVMPGDVIAISAYGKYMNLRSTSNTTPLITSLAAAFGVSSSSLGDQLKVYNGLNNYASTVSGGNHNSDDDSAPKAFVTILFFDRNYNFLDAAWDQVTTAGAQTSATIKQPHDLVSVTARAKETGYAYVFISNEHPTLVDVYFDDVALSITPSPIVSISDYFPFGLQFNMADREGSLEQNRLYNTKELQDELSLSWYDYGARMYMPDLGRWGVVDPLAESYKSYSPFSYVNNNPVFFNDENGLFKIPHHKRATYRALRMAGVSGSRAFTTSLIYGNTIKADVLGANSDYHFDGRNDFTEIVDSWKALQSELKSASLGSTKYGGSETSNFGLLLHTVQDFYAHSNYIELFVKYFQERNGNQKPSAFEIPTFEEVLNNPHYRGLLEYLEKNGLKTGEFNLMDWLSGDDHEKTQKRGETHHDDLAKDASNGKNLYYFDLALAIATKHSADLIAFKLDDNKKKKNPDADKQAAKRSGGF
jgi:RHS repeat-associated protein